MKLIVVIIMFFPFWGFSQDVLDIEYQGYPTGNILAFQYSKQAKMHNEWNYRVGINIISERTEGVQDIEEGVGFGASVGYRYYLNENHTKWFGSLRTDIWFSSIDWINLDDPVLPSTGTTDIIVLQPVLYGGYVFELSEQWRIAPTLGGGVEWNIRENDAEVGEGPITLWGLQIGKEF